MLLSTYNLAWSEYALHTTAVANALIGQVHGDEKVIAANEHLHALQDLYKAKGFNFPLIVIKVSNENSTILAVTVSG